MPYTASITPLASAAQSASGVGSTIIDLGAATTAELLLDISALSSGGLLSVSVETARSSTATTWRTVNEFGAAAVTLADERVFPGLHRYMRVRWTLTGTATFSVTGRSVLVLCTPTDMENIIVERALVRDQNVEYTPADLDGFAQDATDDVSGSLGAVYKWPLTAWGRDVRRKTAELAVFFSMRRRGYSPDEPSGKAYREMYDDVQTWLELVRNQKIELQGVVDATPDIEDGGAYVVTNASRGWGP